MGYRDDLSGKPRASRRETQRQGSDAAIARMTPALFGLFSLLTLWAADPKITPNCALAQRHGITRTNPHSATSSPPCVGDSGGAEYIHVRQRPDSVKFPSNSGIDSPKPSASPLKMRKVELRRLHRVASQRPAPFAITPGFQRARPGRRGARRRVETIRAARPATTDAREAHPAARPQTMACNRLVGEFRAAWRVSTPASGESRDGDAIDEDQRARSQRRQFQDHLRLLPRPDLAHRASGETELAPVV